MLKYNPCKRYNFRVSNVDIFIFAFLHSGDWFFMERVCFQGNICFSFCEYPQLKRLHPQKCSKRKVIFVFNAGTRSLWSFSIFMYLLWRLSKCTCCFLVEVCCPWHGYCQLNMVILGAFLALEGTEFVWSLSSHILEGFFSNVYVYFTCYENVHSFNRYTYFKSVMAFER